MCTQERLAELQTKLKAKWALFRKLAKRGATSSIATLLRQTQELEREINKCKAELG